MNAALAITRDLFRPGQRAGIAVSGGADSVALLRALHDLRGEMGLVLSVLHVHHGMRGGEADEDAAFVEQLSALLDIPCVVFRGDARARAAAHGETLEEAARGLRYGFFEQELNAGGLDAVATAHTLDDQAETVLMKLLRGAWTEGLGGVHPVVTCGRGRIVRPLLRVSRAEIEAFLAARGQAWREDSSNRDPAFTRNRVRQQLLPALRSYNPQIDAQLSRMATVARDEDAWWAGELARVLPQLLLPGKPVRGGGRATSTRSEDASLSIEVERLRGLHPAMRRRVLRAAGERLGVMLGFDAIERLLELAGLGESGGDPGRAGGSRTLSLPLDWLAERTPRELRFSRATARGSSRTAEEYPIPVPGRAEGAAFGLRVITEERGADGGAWVGGGLMLRAWRPGDRVTLRHSRGPKKVKEVLERLKVTGAERESWPVVVGAGAENAANVLWMRGVEVEPVPGLGLRVLDLEAEEQTSAGE